MDFLHWLNRVNQLLQNTLYFSIMFLTSNTDGYHLEQDIVIKAICSNFPFANQYQKTYDPIIPKPCWHSKLESATVDEINPTMPFKMFSL